MVLVQKLHYLFLAGMTVDELMTAITDQDSDLLIKIPGIGKKDSRAISSRIKR